VTVDIWKRKLIHDLFPYSASRMAIERAFLVKHPHVPARLYKYRSFLPNLNRLDALRRNVLRMSAPEKFNDPYDAAVSFYPDRFLIEDLSPEDSIKVAKETNDVIKAGGPGDRFRDGFSLRHAH
jgi:hypothetical protein